MPFPETIFPRITYSRSRQNHILKISNFPANSGKVRYPNEKVPSAYKTRRPERESAILVDPPQAKALGRQLRNIPLDFVSWISSAIFPWRERYRQMAPSPARVDVLYSHRWYFIPFLFKALGDQLRDNPLDFVSWISPAIFP